MLEYTCRDEQTRQETSMTTDEIETRIEELREKRQALVDQLLEPDAQSASLSAGGGSKSYTNRSVADIKAKIKFVEREIQQLQALLGVRPKPGSIIHVVPHYIA